MSPRISAFNRWGSAVASVLLFAAACGGAIGPTGEQSVVTAGGGVTAPPTHGGPDRSQPPAPDEPHPYRLPQTQSFTLGNGMEVVLVPRPGFPTVAARLTVRAGLDASPGNVALPELTVRVMRDGTDEWDATELARFVDSNGLTYAASVETNRVVLSVDALSSSIEPALHLLVQLASEAEFPDDRTRARRAEYAEELDLDSSQPSFHRDRLARRVLFGSHPYASLYPGREQVEALGARDLRRFYRDNWGPGRARLVLVGDLPDDVRSLLDEEFGNWESDAEPWTATEPPIVSTCNEAHVVLRPESVQTTIQWVGSGVNLADPDYFPALVANQVLGGGADSRLFANLRERNSYTYGAYSQLQQLVATSWFAATSDVRGEVTEGALTEFRNEFGRIASESIPSDELRDSQQYLSGVFPIRLETNPQLAGQIAWVLDQGLSLDYLETYRSDVTAVSVEQADAAGRRVVRPDDLALILVGDEEIVLEPARAFSSRVFVYDLDGDLIREEPGALPSSCD